MEINNKKVWYVIFARLTKITKVNFVEIYKSQYLALRTNKSTHVLYEAYHREISLLTETDFFPHV